MRREDQWQGSLAGPLRIVNKPSETGERGGNVWGQRLLLGHSDLLSISLLKYRGAPLARTMHPFYSLFSLLHHRFCIFLIWRAQAPLSWGQRPRRMYLPVESSHFTPLMPSRTIELTTIYYSFMRLCSSVLCSSP